MQHQPLYHRARALGLALALTIAPLGRALPQMAPGLSALVSAVLDPVLVPSPSETALGGPAAGAPVSEFPRASYAGRDERGVPRYLTRSFTDEERELLRRHFGIEEPQRLYLSDTLPGATLTYDTDWDQGERDLVSSYRVGAASVRRAGETWEQLERRLAATRPESFAASTRRADRSLASIDTLVRPRVRRLLDAARQAGFRVRVTETRRSVERQAYLLTLDGHLTHTATSRHADGFAVDVVVDDGDLARPSTRAHWIAFRRWVLTAEAGSFRLIGTPERSWDWPHIEYVDGPAGFHSVEEVLETARRCDERGVVDCTAAWREWDERGPEE